MKRTLILSFALASTIIASGAKFEGTFTMHSEPAKGSPIKDRPTDAKLTVKGEQVAIEPTGGATGMPGKYKILFNSVNQSSTMLMDNGGQKQGFHRMMDPRMTPPDMLPDNDAKITQTQEMRTIDGYKCHKVIIEGARNHTEAWMTDQTGLNISDLAGALMAGKGPGTNGVNIPAKLTGFPIEMTVYDKERKSTTLTHFSSFHKGAVDPMVFSTAGYNIQEMPGGATPPGMQGPGGMPTPGGPGAMPPSPHNMPAGTPPPAPKPVAPKAPVPVSN